MHTDDPARWGHLLELHVLGYEAPHAAYDDWVRNWLRCRIRVEADEGQAGESVETCLLTWEVERLIMWLESISARAPLERHLTFHEGALAFELVHLSNDAIHLRVAFLLSGKGCILPPRAVSTGYWDGQLELELHEHQVNGALASLRAALARYPRRH